MHILVTDDDDSSRYLLVSMLTASGHDVEGAADGREALALARAHTPDLIVSDILMPGMDGYQLCREWRADEQLKSVPFVFYTANYTDPDDERFALDLGADRFLVKPMDPLALLRELDQLMDMAVSGNLTPRLPDGDESTLLKEYNARLVNKLEQQLAEVQSANEQLSDTANALRQTEQALRGLISAAPVAIVTLDGEGAVTMWNPAAESIFGWQHSEILGGPCPLTAEDGSRDCLKLLLSATTQVAGQESRVLARDGHVVDVSLSAARLGPQLEDGVLALITDVTAQKATKDDLARTVGKLSEMMDSTVMAIAKIVEARDPYTSGHQERVGQLAAAIAVEMGYSEEFVNGIRLAGLIHDIGKVYVPAEILTRPRKLTEVEFNIVKLHPQVAYDVLASIDFPWPLATYIIQHHERLDGSGYPMGLHAEEIMPGSRILAVADVVEAMSSHRPYKLASGVEAALDEIGQNAGRLYDADVVEACTRLFKEKGFELAPVPLSIV